MCFGSADMIEKANNKRAEQKEAGKDLISNFADYDVWMELFKEHGIRCPNHYLIPEQKIMRRYLKKLGVTEKEYKSWTGFKTLEEFHESNPRFPLYAWLGTVCEFLEMREDIAVLLRCEDILFTD